MSIGHLESFWALFLIAVAIGLDGFSVSLGIGLQPIRLRRIVLIGAVIGMFHFLLPFAGMMIGQVMSVRWEHMTSFFSGVLLVFIGLYILFSAMQQKSALLFHPHSMQIFSLALIVSLDSFPVGVSLGLSGFSTVLVLSMFGMTAMLFSWTGMLLGRKVHQMLGVYSELLSGFILLALGLYSMF